LSIADADFERFQNGRQHIAFVGVTSSHFQSDTSVKENYKFQE